MIKSALKKRYLSLTFAIFFVFLISTIVAWKITQSVAEQESKNRFYQSSLNIQSWVQIKLNLYILGAEGLSGLIEGSDNVRRDEWSTYIKKVNLIKDYPGISSINYVEKVENKDKLAFEESVRKDTSLNPKGYPDFNIYPDGERNEYFIVKYIEPLEGREKALGFDLGSESKRLKALERARDSGKASSTGKIILATTNSPGFGLLIPIYKTGTNLNNLEEKRTNIKGFVYPIFRGSEMFQAVYGKTDLFPNLDFEIYQNDNLTEKNLLYDHDSDLKISQINNQSRLITKETIKIDSQKWVILIATKDGLGLTKSQQLLPTVVLISGLSFSFVFLFLFIHRIKQDFSIKKSEAKD